MSTASQIDKQAWWTLPLGEAHIGLPAYIDSILQMNNRRFVDYVRFAGLYGNWEAAPITGSFLASGLPFGRFYKRLSFNLTQSMVETVYNARASEYGRLQASSVDGDYKQFMMAKMLTMALRNEFEVQGYESKFSNICRDALIFGNGLSTVYKHGGGDSGAPAEPRIARQFSPEIVVDPYENMTDGWPLCFSVVRFVSRYALARRYPKYAREIMTAQTEPGHFIRTRGDDNIRVDESWIRSVPGAIGRHSVCVTGASLEDDDYDHDAPPFVNTPWSAPLQGWYAQGLVDQLMGLQMKTNELLEIISEAHKLFAHPLMLVEETSNVNTALIQNIPGKILKYRQTKPEIPTWQLVAPEVYNHLETIYRKAYEIAGVNPYMAQAKTIPRLESSKAQRSMEDINDKRHFSFARRCEEGTEQLAQLFCRVAAECDEENGYKSKMPCSQYFKNISWGDIKYEVDKFHIKLGTVSPLIGKDSDKLQDVLDMMNMGELSPTQLRQYLDNPDIQRAASLATASDDYIEWVIYQMTIEDEPQRLDDFVDKKAAFSACIQHYLIGERLGWHSPAARENLLDYLVQLKNALTQDLQPQAGPGTQPAQPQQPLPPTPTLGAGLPPQQTINVNQNNGQPGQ